MPSPRIIPLTGLILVLLVGLAGCGSNEPVPIAMDPGEPITRAAAFDTLLSINEAHAAQQRISVAQLRQHDNLCVLLVNGIQVRPAATIDYANGMLSAIRHEEIIEVGIRNLNEDATIYASTGCPLMVLTWQEDAPMGGFGVFASEADARAYLDKVAQAFVTLGGTVSRRIRHDKSGATTGN